MITVTVSDAGDLLDVVVFATHEAARRFFEAMIEDGWEAELNEATLVQDEDVDAVIASWRAMSGDDEQEAWDAVEEGQE